jgi:hypothetical protein
MLELLKISTPSICSALSATLPRNAGPDSVTSKVPADARAVRHVVEAHLVGLRELRRLCIRPGIRRHPPAIARHTDDHAVRQSNTLEHRFAKRKDALRASHRVEVVYFQKQTAVD